MKKLSSFQQKLIDEIVNAKNSGKKYILFLPRKAGLKAVNDFLNKIHDTKSTK